MTKTLRGDALQALENWSKDTPMRSFLGGMGNTILGPKLVPIFVAAALAGCAQADDFLCPQGACGWSDAETARLSAMADFPDATPTDRSNKYAGDPATEQLGRKFFWDTRFSGVSTGTDALKRPMPFGRAAKGQPLNISCQTCHDLKRGGIDPSSVPGNVSLGAGWTDLNASTVYNDAYFPLVSWTGRVDSLWAQAAGSIEGSMGCSRLRAAWTIATYYRAEYSAVFTDWPLPMTGTIGEVTPTLETQAPLAGQCKGTPTCPTTCREVHDDTTGVTGCWPRFPLDGRPGSKPGCQPGDASEPFGDAYDCMDPADQAAVTRVVVNYGKAVAAFEFKLVSRDSAFDRFVTDLRAGRANESTEISPEAKNGARLFVGKAGCSDCHSGPLLSDMTFHDVGVAPVGMGIPTLADCPKGGVCDCVTPANCLPFGAFDGIPKMRKNAYRRETMWSDDPTDTSRKAWMDMPMEQIPKGSFRTPGLRDVALTAPYMHTGSLATLEDVVAHYNRGADTQAVGDVAPQLQPLYLTPREQSQLVAFLKTLTGAPLPAELTDKPNLPQ
jgi:cytochrome c peroxidase